MLNPGVLGKNRGETTSQMAIAIATKIPEVVCTTGLAACGFFFFLVDDGLDGPTLLGYISLIDRPLGLRPSSRCSTQEGALRGADHGCALIGLGLVYVLFRLKTTVWLSPPG